MKTASQSDRARSPSEHAAAGATLIEVVEQLRASNEALALENARLRGEADAQARHFASFPLLNPNPVLETDLSGEIRFCNPATRQLFESLGLKVEHAAPFLPSDFGKVVADLQQRLPGPSWCEVTLCGRTFVEHFYLAPGREAVRIYAHEVTERERALHKSVGRLELLAAIAGALLQDPDPQRAVEALCTRVLHFLGCHVFFNYLVAGDGRALRLNACAGIPAAEAARIETLEFGVAICGCVARDGRRIVAESVQSSSDGRTALVKSYGVRAYACHPLRAPGGAVIGTLSFGARDRDRFDDEELSLMKAVADLVATAMIRVRDTRALRESKGELERKLAELAMVNAELEAFVYSASHDLREPLRAVSGFAQMVLARHAGCLDDRGIDYVRRIERGAEKMNRLIEDLLSLSRVSRRKIERATVDVSLIARAAVAELRERDPARDVEVDITPGLTVVADRGLIEIAVSNLLANAWKFTSQAAPARIRFGSVACEGRTAYFVEDNGVGFDPAYASQLFQPFHRLHAGGEYPGTGIGLALVGRVVSRHGGKVWAEGRPGAGATFFFSLGDSR